MFRFVTEPELESGEIVILGRISSASNASLLAQLSGSEIKVIYKPVMGEAPLWDFPDGNLASRERLAYLISEIGGFHCVPTTVLREGKFGIGSVQQWVESDYPEDLSELAQSKDEKLRNLALFDVVINNADRKFGHILIAPDYILGCDHGPTFNVENKLRTVLWQFRGDELLPSEVTQLKDLKEIVLVSKIKEQILTLITENEYLALLERIDKLIDEKVFPEPSEDWPAIPWPPV